MQRFKIGEVALHKVDNRKLLISNYDEKYDVYTCICTGSPFGYTSINCSDFELKKG